MYGGVHYFSFFTHCSINLSPKKRETVNGATQKIAEAAWDHKTSSFLGAYDGLEVSSYQDINTKDHGIQETKIGQ